MINIRPAILEDLDTVRQLNDKIFIKNSEYDEDMVPHFALTAEGEKYFRESIETKEGCFFIAEVEGEVVGYVNGAKLDLPYRKSKYFEIQNLGVIPERKKQGIGSMLLEKASVWAKNNGFEKIYLNSYIKNSEAVNFYRSKGFEDIDVCLEKKI